MTLPAFSAAGTGSTGNPSWPSHSTGHLGLLFVESSGANPVDTPSGWTVIPGFPVITPSTRLSGFYRFATSGAESAPTVTGTALDHTWAVIITYTGVNTINPFHLVSTSISNSTTRKGFMGLTTYLADCLIVNVLAWQIDNAGPLGSGETNADLGSLTERYDAGTTAGDGGGLYINDGTKAAKGPFTFTTVTFSSAIVAGFATIALQAADQSFGTKSQIINNKRRTMFCKQSTAQDWRFAMFDSADGVTGKTGLTLAVTIQKQGDTSFASISPTVTEIGSGHYNAALTTTHMNTVGNVSLRATATGAIPADCPNAIDVIGFDKTDAAALGLSRIDAAITSRLAPTTAGRTLDVSAGGEAGIDWANIGSPTTTVGLSGTTVKTATDVETDTQDIQTRLPAALTGAGNMKADALRVNGSATGASNLALQFDGTGLTGGTFPAPQAQITTLSSDSAAGLADLQSRLATIDGRVDTEVAAIKAKTDNLPSDPADASDIAAAFSTVNSTLATIASYIDTEIASMIATLATLATSAALATAKTAIDGIKAKTDSLTFTVANHVDANALSGGGGMTLNDLLTYEYAPGRSVVGFFRRVGSSVERARGLKGTLVEFLTQAGDVIWSITQSTTAGTRTTINLGATEDPP